MGGTGELGGAASETSGRRVALDALRGLIMVVMALDHVRDFWSNADFDPTDPATTTVAYFATRWITHLCAPWFMLLAGAGAALAQGRGRDRATTARFLWTRGLWLIVLELTVINLGWRGLSYDPTFVRVMVLCALGASMIALAGLIYLPTGAIAAIAIALIVGHDAFDSVRPAQLGGLAWLWHLVHVRGFIGARPGHGPSMFVLYPLVPWIGVMALGYCGGVWLDRLRAAPRARARRLAAIGGALLVAFVAVRALNVYGDPAPWRPYPTTTQTVLSFLAVSKYPPSLAFLLATIGVGLIVLAAIERTAAARPWRVLQVFGRVPMAFYLLHIPLLTITFEAAYRIAHGAWRHGEGWGFGLPIVYALWIAYVVALYPVCRWFAGVKARRRDWWLGYL